MTRYRSAFWGTAYLLFVLVVCFSALVIVDRVIGSGESRGLIFPPNTEERYRTNEFDFTAKIDVIGIRMGSERQSSGWGSPCILCIGDSFTFGWGVSDSETWPSKLEAYLKKNGIQIQVYNCGQPGTTTTEYKEILRRVVPVLHPDLVLVGVLQGDDLADIYQARFIQKKSRAADFFFGNIIRLLPHKSPQEAWTLQAGGILSRMNVLEKIHYSTLDDTVRVMFERGELNPALVSYWIDFPDRYEVFNNPQAPATQYAYREMTGDIREMRDIFPRLVFVNLPVTYYRDSQGVDSLYKSLAEGARLPYIKVNLSPGDYFKFDGHPNAHGYEEIAEQIGSELIEKGIIH